MNKIGISVTLKKDFSVVRETLERIGIINHKTKSVFPSCYCVESKEQGIYRIVHFKELFPLFGRETTYSESDAIRRNTVVVLLKNWGIIDVVDITEVEQIQSQKLDVLKHSEKSGYTIQHKFKFNSHVVVD